MKLLITGICGFVGSTLARNLLEADVASEIVGIDNFSRAGSELNRRPLRDLGCRVIQGDIRSAADVDSLPKVDWVIDAAANPSVLAGVDGKTSSRQLVEHNLFGTINLLEYCRTHQSGFILLSTSRVYSIAPLAGLRMTVDNDGFRLDPDQQFPCGISECGVAEHFSTNPPVSLYGSTKAASERLALEYGAAFDFPVWINRCGVMAGAGQFGHPAQGIFAFWIHSFREQAPLKYIGFGRTGHQVRDCLHPRDVVPLMQQQFTESADTDKPHVVNVSSGIDNSMSLAQLTRWCADRFPDSATPTHHNSSLASSESRETRPFDIPWMVLDSRRCRDIWDWQPTTPITSVLEEIAKHAEKHADWLAISG